MYKFKYCIKLLFVFCILSSSVVIDIGVENGPNPTVVEAAISYR